MPKCLMCVCLHACAVCFKGAQCTHVGGGAHVGEYAHTSIGHACVCMCVQFKSGMCMLYETRCPYC